MNLFVTGGTGFFGKALLRYWQNNSPNFEKIILLSRSPNVFLDKYSDLVEELPIEFIKGDILNLSESDFDLKFDVVLHAATDSTIGPSLDRLEVYRQITQGTEEVLKFAINHSCQKFILISSGGVYGAQPSSMEKISEDYLGIPDPLDPNSAYGIGKRAAEYLTSLYADEYGFDFVIARCFAFIGEDLPLDKHFAIGNFIRDALNNKDIIIKGDGSPIRSYMYQEDLAYVLNLLIKNSYQIKTLNIGSDESYTLKEIASRIKKQCKKSINIKINGARDGNIKNQYTPKVEKMVSIAGDYKFKNLNESIENTLQRLVNP